jgi:hypothetical protein
MRNGSMIVLNCGGTAGAYERIIEVHAARSPSGLGRFPFKEEVRGSNPLRATDAMFTQGLWRGASALVRFSAVTVAFLTVAFLHRAARPSVQ